jgi:streptogrisin C
MRAHRRLAAVLVGAAVLLGGAAFAMPAHADTTAGAAATPPDAATDQAARTYRGAYPRLTTAQARAAVSGEQARFDFYSIMSADPATYGGAWFDPPSGVVHVAVTTAMARSRAVSLAAVLGLRVETHLVARSFVALERQAQAISAGTDALARAAQGHVGIDVQRNQVTVARTPALNRATARSLRLPAGVALATGAPVQGENDVCNSRTTCNDSLRAGLQTNRGCSLAFTARGNGARWVLTAGHCTTGNGVPWMTGGATFGVMRAALFSGPIDAAIIEVNQAPYSGHTTGGIYMDTASGRRVDVVGVADRLSMIVTGERVCLSANTPEPNGLNPCGIVGASVDPNHSGMVRVDGLDACPGDSGGGWYWPADQGRFAYGIHSGSATGCHGDGGGNWSRFSAIARIGNTFGFPLTIETSPGQVVQSCASSLPFHFLGGNQFGVSWASNSWLVASDFSRCKYFGELWIHPAGGTAHQTGFIDFWIPRP